MKLSVILAPYDSGHYQSGFGQGPEALVAGGLVDALTLAGGCAMNSVANGKVLLVEKGFTKSVLRYVLR